MKILMPLVGIGSGVWGAIASHLAGNSNAMWWAIAAATWAANCLFHAITQRGAAYAAGA